jgi:hypothetical protein
MAGIATIAALAKKTVENLRMLFPSLNSFARGELGRADYALMLLLHYFDSGFAADI